MVTEAWDMVTADQANGAWRAGTWRAWYMASMNHCIASVTVGTLACASLTMVPVCAAR